MDTIAADQRFEPGSAKTNFEIRDIGPLSKKGIYLAVQVIIRMCTTRKLININMRPISTTKRNFNLTAGTTSPSKNRSSARAQEVWLKVKLPC